MTEQTGVPIGALIVDDQADVRLLMRLAIDAANQAVFVACEASSGREALDQMEQCDPEVIVLDAVMPGLDGLETAMEIRRRRPDQRMVLYSAYLDEELQHKAEGVGIEICLSKGDYERIPHALIAAASAGADE